MKQLEARYDLILFFLFPFCFITLLLYQFASNELTQIARCNWIFTIFLLALACLPKAARTLGDKTCTRIPFKWLSALFLSQLLLNLTIWSLTKLIQINVEVKQYYFNVDMIHLALLTGGFPWGFMILMTLTLGFFSYHQKARPLLSSTYKPFFNNSHTDSIGIAVDTYARFVSFAIIIYFLALLTISLILFFHQLFGFPFASGVKINVILVNCVLFLILSHPLWMKFIHFLVHQRVSAVLILVGFAVLLSVVYLCLSPLSDLFISMSPLFNVNHEEASLPCSQESILIFVTLTGLALSMIIAAYIAYISRDKTLRQIILYSFLAHLLSLGILEILQGLIDTASTLPPLLAMIVCSTVIPGIMLRKKNVTYFLRATLPTDAPIKIRSIYRFLRMVPLLIVSLVCVYMATQLRMWNYIVVIGFLPPLGISLISYMAWSYVFFSRYN
jgi:BCCT, betaine/carnitine/choline family transporter